MAFNPKFSKVSTVQECADLINKPHEDYPDRVDNTAAMIQMILDSGVTEITEYACKSIHGFIMHDIETRSKGCWRSTTVTVGTDTPPPPWMIAGEMQEHGMFPMQFTSMDESDIIRWYRQFQIIHPFLDGNGRVGGVIAAVASYKLFNGECLLAPCQ